MGYQQDLIIDVGMHHGDDTDFYLKKGFRVVGVEANPRLVQMVEKRFVPQIAEGRLTVIPFAIAAAPGLVDFYVNEECDEWSSLLPDAGTYKGTRASVIKVRSIVFDKILEEHGIPYYLKIDIEGSDVHCLEALRHFRERPRFVSVEAQDLSLLAHLHVLGYSRFKLVNQSLHPYVHLPFPPREGNYVDTTFTNYMSGPFGEETEREWLSLEQVAFAYLNCRWWFSDKLKKKTSDDGHDDNPAHMPFIAQNGTFYRITRKLKSLASKTRYHAQRLTIRSTLDHFAPQILPGWYDFHARLDRPEDSEPGEAERLQG